MTKSILAGAKLVLALAFAQTLAVAPVSAAEETEIPHVAWSFDGLFGTYDPAQLQRGFQVYKEVCSACHSLNLVHYRNLADLGYQEDEIKALAAEVEVTDGPNDEGEMFERPGLPSDRFKAPFPNEEAARAANGGAYPPDLSLIAKSREAGPDYTHAILTGYDEPPADLDPPLMEGMNYNKYFPGHQIAMPPPLSDDAVSYADGTPATVDQMSQDVSAFLMWAAEPTLVVRKQTGISVILFLLALTGVLYAAKRKIWADVH